MRMHSVGKCNPNLIVGAFLIFSIIVLYQYWVVSTVNHELAQKVHALERQVVSVSNANVALQNNLEKILGEKSKVETHLKVEKLEESKKESSIKTLQNDLEIAKQEVTNYKEELVKVESNIKGRDREILKLKNKILSLEAQLAEKNNLVEKKDKELKDAKEKLIKSSSTKASSSSSKIAQPVQDDLQPVLLNDPAVPFPDGWMNPLPKNSKSQSLNGKVNIKANIGISRRGPQVIIFDDPKSPRVKPRFSVADMKPEDIKMKKPEESPVIRGHEIEAQMNPEAIHSPAEPLKQPNKAGGILDDKVEIGGGVLPLPENHKDINLDAAEDDKDHNKDPEIADDSPDGNLKDNPVGPPPLNNNNNNYPQINNNVDSPVINQPPEDRESAHFANQQRY